MRKIFNYKFKIIDLPVKMTDLLQIKKIILKKQCLKNVYPYT